MFPSAVRMAKSLKYPGWKEWRFPKTLSPTSEIQKKLPTLPVPELSQTVPRVLEYCIPLAKGNELEELKKKAEKFEASGIAQTLQDRLLKRREHERSWIAEWWDEDAYMRYRDSIVVNVTYYYGFDLISPDPSLTTALIVKEALKYRHAVATGEIVPDKIGNDELCMESYKWAFNANRIPATPADYAVKLNDFDPEGNNFIVIYKNRFFLVPTISPEGREFTTGEFKQAIDNIYKKQEEGLPVGILTAINRDNWAEAYGHLLEKNASVLDKINKAAFAVCLDDASPDPHLHPVRNGSPNLTSEGMVDFCKRLWKGDHNSGSNRWWDKPCQWIVYKNGHSGFIGEHSCMDGTPTARLNDELTRNLISDNPTFSSAEDLKVSSVPQVTPLPFDLDATSQEYIKKGLAEFNAHTSQYDLFYLRYENYGKDEIKKCGVSPDGWNQMLFQLAYYLTHGECCGTYEAAQVRRFQLGRTETVRVCTEKTKKFVESVVDPSTSSEEKIRLFKDAIKQQGSDVKLASNAQGVDRHLFGLKKVVQTDAEREQASFLYDPLLVRSSTWNMSTSQIYIRKAPAYGWGPVVNDGYGIPYMVHPECLQFTLSCRKDMPGQKFINNLEKAADLVMDLFKQPKAKL